MNGKLKQIIIDLNKFTGKKSEEEIGDGPILEVFKPIEAIENGSVLQIAFVVNEGLLMNLQRGFLGGPLKILQKKTPGLKIEWHELMGPEEMEEFKRSNAFAQLEKTLSDDNAWAEKVEEETDPETIKKNVAEAKERMRLFEEKVLELSLPFREKSFSSFPGSEEFPVSAFQCVLIASKNVPE